MNTSATPPDPLLCRHCGVLGVPRVEPGTGPHAHKALI
jgi:hypothetical protein